jgi:hypothetical protein
MQEQRRAKRVPSILEGCITLEGQSSPMPCTIRDLSVTGARIWLPKPTDLPNEFVLGIPKLEQSLKVRLVWSKDRTHGVTFLEELDATRGDDVTALLEALRTADDAKRQEIASERPILLARKAPETFTRSWWRSLCRLLGKSD